MKPLFFHFTSILRLILGVAIFLLLIYHVDFTVFSSLSAEQITFAILIAAILIGTTALEAARLRTLCPYDIPFREILRVVFVAFFFTNLLPSSIGGDGYKILKIGKNYSYTKATALVLIERVLGLATLIIGSLILAAFLGGGWIEDYLALRNEVNVDIDVSRYATWTVAAFFLTAIIVILLFRRNLFRFIRDFYEALTELPLSRAVYVLLWSIVLHSSRSILLCLILTTVGYELSLPQAWVVISFVAIASLIPLSIGGLGIREAAFVLALQPFAVVSSWALYAGLVFRLGSIGQAAVGAFLLTRERHRNPTEKTS